MGLPSWVWWDYSSDYRLLRSVCCEVRTCIQTAWLSRRDMVDCVVCRPIAWWRMPRQSNINLYKLGVGPSASARWHELYSAGLRWGVSRVTGQDATRKEVRHLQQVGLQWCLFSAGVACHVSTCVSVSKQEVQTVCSLLSFVRILLIRAELRHPHN